MKPPIVARWLWTRLAPARIRDDVMCDLGEEYRRYKYPELGAFRAGVWYTHQVVSALIAFHTTYRRPSQPSLPPPPNRDGTWSALMNSLIQDLRFLLLSL